MWQVSNPGYGVYIIYGVARQVYQKSKSHKRSPAGQPQ